MSTKSFIPPRDVGAANVQIFSSNGEAITSQELADPRFPVTFEAREEGDFFARISPIGEESRLVTFRAGPDTPQTILASELRASSGEASSVLRAVTGTNLHLTTTHPDARAGYSIPNANLQLKPDVDVPFKVLLANQSLANPTISRIAVGLSIDTAPMRFGGWRPFAGPWSLEQNAEGETWSLDVHRDAHDPHLDPSNARLRLHIAVERQKVLRLLLPVFLGGARVTLRATAADIDVSIRPLDETLHVLMQAFAAGSEADPLVLLDRVARTDAGSLDGDPWALVVFGLLAQRKHLDAFTKADALGAAKRFPWMSDASIIAANLILADTSPNVGEALSHLEHARRIGAPYFAALNGLLGDLLVTLAADAPQEDHRRRAASELSIWRRRIPFQASAGPYFAWLTRGGWRNRANLDRRYQRPVFEGVYVREALQASDVVEKPLADFPDHDLDEANDS